MVPLSEPIVLPADIQITPVAELAPSATQGLDARPDDCVVHRPGGRSRIKLVNADSADLLNEFHRPRTVAAAVAAFSRRRGADSHRVLTDALPMISDLVREGLLVPAGSPAVSEIVPTLEPGQQVAAYEVITCLQVTVDSELYQAAGKDGQTCALKMGRSHDHLRHSMLLNEARVLAHLDGRNSPSLLAVGTFANRPYFVTDWRMGVHPDVTARESREGGSGVGRRSLLNLCCAILDAYSHLHGQHVVHGDVHPRNVLVAPSGEVTVLDFGLARVTQDQSPGPAARGGVHHFFEPEYAVCLREGRPGPAATMRGEQYALAALLYLLITGSHYVRFSPYEAKLLQQIITDRPRPFAQCGVRPWPGAEAPLAIALSKQPDSRFPSVAELATRFRQLDPPVAPHPTPHPQLVREERFLRRVLDRLGVDGALAAEGLGRPPTASVNFGAAGIAYGLYRAAVALEDPTVVAAADVWLSRALKESELERGFHREDAGLSPALVGRHSLYHSVCGVYVVQATLSRAAGEPEEYRAAVEAFVDASQGDSPMWDLALGRASTLLGCTMLHESNAQENDTRLRDLGLYTQQHLLRHVTNRGHLADTYNLGIAHGWAGILYAILRWSAATETSLPDVIADRLRILATRAEPWGRGVRWKWVTPDQTHARVGMYMPGWCNGGAGFVHLWTLAHQLLDDERFLQLAVDAAWNTWESPTATAPADLCCGLAGRAFALLNLYRSTGEQVWLDRARQLASRAVDTAEANRDSDYRHSLYRGDIGVAVLVADLLRPDHAAMPMFESERWPKLAELAC